MNNRWRHIVSIVLAIGFAMSTVFVCAPAVAAPTAEGHCKPASTMQAGCRHCHQKNAMDCCATSMPQPASVPQDSQQQGTRTAPTAAPAPVDAVVAIPSLPQPSAARAFRDAPSHGYRSTDLPTLNAVFLI